MACPAGPLKILLIKTSSLGDVVHNLPVATALRARFPEAQLDWVVEEAYTDIPRLHPAIARVIPVALRRWRRHLFSAATWAEVAAFRRELRRVAYDLVLDTQGLIKSSLVGRQAQLSSGGLRVGYAASVAREPLAALGYDRGVAIARSLHAVERNHRLAAAAGHYDPGGDIDYGIAAAPLTAGWLPAPPYALLFTASSRDDKSWPSPAWRELAAKLAAGGLSPVLPAGSAQERQRATALASAMGPAARVAPRLGLAEMARLCAGARLVIGVDTGLTHLAAALGRPTLCLFSGSDPVLTGVYGGSGAGQSVRNLGQRGSPPTSAEAAAVAAELLAGKAA